MERNQYIGYNVTTEAITLDVPAKNSNSRVYVPLRSISQLFGYQVKWEDHKVTIHSPLSNWRSWYQGSLAESRKFATKIPTSANLKYLHVPLDVENQSEENTLTYLFPQGEALRFYYIFKNTVSLIQLKNDFPVIVWQAHIQEGDSIQNFVEGKFSDQRGTAPSIHKPFLYYSMGMFGDSNTEESGYIDLDQKITRTGYKHDVGGNVTNKEGTISLEFPDEKRVDAIIGQ